MTDHISIESFRDELGPAKIVHIYDPAAGLRAIVVVDNVACGPAIGGVRMAADVTVDEVFRLARAMTLKNAAAGLAHGGGKSGIIADPKTCDREALIRAFAHAIRDLNEYIPGPDMGTNETCMAYIHDEIGRAVGMPSVFGGIPLDELGATGFGVAQSAIVAAGYMGMDLKGARVAIEGYGNVGQHAARFLEQEGAVLIAASDSMGAVYNADGISTSSLTAAKKEGGSVTSFADAKVIGSADLFALDCDILIPAARPDCIRMDNVDSVKAKLILQGANIPITADAEAALHERGVVNVPDFIANAGGVICAAAEYHGSTEAAAFAEIGEKIRSNIKEVLESASRESIPIRTAATQMAHRRIREAMKLRRHF